MKTTKIKQKKVECCRRRVVFWVGDSWIKPVVFLERALSVGHLFKDIVLCTTESLLRKMFDKQLQYY